MATTVTENNVPSPIVGPLTVVSTGAVFVSVTAMVKLACEVAPPVSVTRTVTGYVPGPSPSLGVQLKTPVVGTIVAPVGAVMRL